MVEIPLTEDILQKEKDIIIKTFYEQLLLNKVEVNDQNQVENTSVNVTTVPVGQTLFITDFAFGVTSSAVGGGIGSMDFGNTNTGFQLLKEVQQGNDIYISHAFVIPLKLGAGESVVISSLGAGTIVDGSIRGFLVQQ